MLSTSPQTDSSARALHGTHQPPRTRKNQRAQYILVSLPFFLFCLSSFVSYLSVQPIYPVLLPLSLWSLFILSGPSSLSRCFSRPPPRPPLFPLVQVRPTRRADLYLPRGLRQAARARRGHASCQRRQPQAAAADDVAAQRCFGRLGGNRGRRRRHVGRGSTCRGGGVRGGRAQVFHGRSAATTR